MAILTTTDQGLNFTGGSSFIKTGTSTVMSFTTSGNVGIGTTNPSSKLYIGTYGSSINSSTLPTTPANHLITLTPPSTTNYYGGGIGWSEGTNVAASINAYDAGTGGALGLVFSTGNNTTLSEALRINSSGNVGIGTTNPSAKLDIDSVFTFNTSTDLLTITNNQNTGGIKLSGGNSRIYFGNYRAIEGDQAGGTLYIGEGYGAISLMDDVYINGQLTLNGYVQAGNVKFERGGINNSSYTMLCTVNGDRLASIVNMTITGTSGGVVLCSSFEINVNHYQDIHVRSLSGDYTEATIRITSNNNEDYSIELKHNGSTTTTVEVCVFPQAGETITPTTTDPNYTGTEYVHLATEGIRFGGTDGATESSNLVVDGKVGIGTANPAQKLHVNGNVDIDNGGILLQQAYGINFGVSGYDIAMPTTTRLGIKTAGSESISILNTGNVGIGTTSPSAKLHISEQAENNYFLKLQGTYGSGNTYGFKTNGGNSEVLSLYDLTASNRIAVFGNTETSFATGGSTRFLINSAGKIQIGNNIPMWSGSYGGALFLKGNNATSDRYAQLTEVDSTGAAISTGLVVRAGNVGIGTTSPTASLHINKSTPSITLETTANSNDPIINLKSNGAITGEGAQMWYDNSIGSLHIQTTYPNNAADIVFHTATGADKSTGNVRMVIGGDGNVGIGTTSPAQPLHVLNDSSANVHAKIRVQGGSTSGYADLGVQSNYVRLLVNDVQTTAYSGAVQYNYINGNVATTLTSTGLGISTTNPQAALHVAGSIGNSPTGDGVLMGLNNNYGHIQLNGSTGSYIDFSSSGVDRKGRILYNNAGNYMQIQTNGSDKVRITSSGNVGIGTTGPSRTLHIVDSAGPTIKFQRSSSADLEFTFGTANASIASAGEIQFRANGGTTNKFIINNSQIQSNAKFLVNTNSGIDVHTSDSGNILLSGNSSATGNPDQFFLKHNLGNVELGNSRGNINITSGNVGIGTTSPSRPLDVQSAATSIIANFKYTGAAYSSIDLSNTVGSARISSLNNDLLLSPAGTERMRINSSGTVGINNSSLKTVNTFQSNLFVGETLYIANYNVGGNQQAVFGCNTYYNSGYKAVTAATSAAMINIGIGDFNFNTAPTVAADATQTFTTRVVIKNSGNVGIGTTSPSNKLHVYEAVNRTTAIVQNNNHTARFEAFGNATAIDTTASNGVFIRYNGSNRVHFEAGGNVGIGTDSPDQKLEVNGNAHLNYSLIGRGIRSSNRGELHLNATSTNDVSEIFFGHGDGYTEGNIRWAISDRGFTDGRLDLYRGPAFGGFSAIQSWDENGYVGIGTTSPEALLDIGGGDGTPLGTQFRAVIKGTSARTLYLDSDSSGASMWWGSGNTPHFAIDSISGGGAGFWTYSGGWSQRLTINSSGNVGIGTNNPASKLTVGGNATGFSTGMQVWQSGQTALSGDVGGKAATFFGTSGLSNSSIVNIYSTDAYTTQRGGEIGFGGKYASAGNVAQFAKIRSFKTNATNGGVNYGGGLEFWTRPNGSAAVPRMHINGDGNVGIGTTSPNAILDISDATNDNLRIGTRGGNMSLFSVTDAGAASPLAFEGSQFNFITGNVGIGTTGPATKLHVVGRARFDDTQINAKGVYADYFSSGQSLTLNSGASASILFKIGNTTALTLDSSENATFAGYTSTPNSYAQNFYVTSSGTNITNRIDNDGTQLYITYSGTSNRALEIKNSNGDATFAGDIRSIGTIGVTQSDGDYLAKLYQSSADGFLELFTGQATPTSRTKITSYGDSYINPSNGNVGIGTTSPAYKLDVAGSARIEGDLDLGSGFKIANYGGSYWQRIRTEDSSLSTTNAFNFETRNGSGSFIEHMVIRNDGNVGIGVTNPSYKLQVGGSIVGTSKNFIIDHPTKEGKKLLHGCIEGPEAAVYFRGKSTSNIIEMPDYWIGLVDIDTMTVDITPWGPNQDIYVESIADDGEITIAANTEEPLNYFYVVYGERKDIDKLEIEIVDPEYSD
jgi:hypothetical protein